MKWETLILKKKVVSGKDELDNDTYEFEEYLTTEGRATAWTSEELTIEDREFTRSNRKILTPASKEDISLVEKVVFAGTEYDVKATKNLGKFRVLIVEDYGND